MVKSHWYGNSHLSVIGFLVYNLADTCWYLASQMSGLPSTRLIAGPHGESPRWPAKRRPCPVSKSWALLVALLRFGYIRSIAHSKMSPTHDTICLGWHRKYMKVPFYCIDAHMSTHNPFLQHIWPKAWWFVLTSPSRSARIRTQSSSQRSVQTGSSLKFHIIKSDGLSVRL